MIYNDLSFVVTLDPFHPGKFQLIAHAPIDHVIDTNRLTGVMEIRRETPEEDRKTVAHAVAPPTTDEIRAATRAIRAKAKREARAAWIAGKAARDRATGMYGANGGSSARSGEARTARVCLGRGKGVARDRDEEYGVADMTGRGGSGEGGW